MPDRIVRAGILTSDPVNTLSWPAEVLYRRLHSIVDDYGRYDGRSSLLRAHLYPLKIDKVSEADVGKWLTECVTAGLVSLYRVEGRPYVEVLKFGARVRAETSKWPSPEGADMHPRASAVICPQPHADAAVFVGVVEVVVEGVVDKARKRAPGFDAAEIDLPAWLDREVWLLWVKDRAARRKAITEDAARLQVAKLGEYRAAGHSPNAVIDHSIAGGYSGLFPPRADGRAQLPALDRERENARTTAEAKKVLFGAKETIDA